MKNPSSAGGTGAFSIQTVRGSTVIDQNPYFPPFGIAVAPEPITVTLITEGSLAANFKPVYTYNIDVEKHLRPGTWLRFYFPDNFTIPTTFKCYSLEFDTYFECTKFEDYNIVIFPPLTTWAPPGNYKIQFFGI